MIQFHEAHKYILFSGRILNPEARTDTSQMTKSSGDSTLRLRSTVSQVGAELSPVVWLCMKIDHMENRPMGSVNRPKVGLEVLQSTVSALVMTVITVGDTINM